MSGQCREKPIWLKKKIPTGPNLYQVDQLLARYKLNTVCREARCPNRFECYHQGTATFLLLGNICTRNCGFCAVRQGVPGPLDLNEPERIAEVVEALQLNFVVLTSVTRDDLSDGGATVFSKAIEKLLKKRPEIIIETLIPDFKGSAGSLEKALSYPPHVLNHNIETVPDLYPTVRPQADYQRSLELLSRARRYCPNTIIKSGIMLGLGESRKELMNSMEDLLQAGCEVLTLGQYLQPKKNKIPVARYLLPEEFEIYREEALNIGFTEVVAGPYVRSSFHAHEAYLKANRLRSAHLLKESLRRNRT